MTCLSINQKDIDAVVFDFDGTLAKLNIDFDFMRKSVDDLLRHYEIDPGSLVNGYILEKMHEAESLLKISSLDRAKSFLSEAYQAIEKIEIDAAMQGQLFEQTKELLNSLRMNGILTGIITRNCRPAVHTVFPDISKYCPVVICREDVLKVKPDPGHLIHALNLLSATVHRSIMIGDHPLDVQTGQNAGSLTAGVTTGHFTESDFIKAGADVVLCRASDILQYLKTI